MAEVVVTIRDGDTVGTGTLPITDGAALKLEWGSMWGMLSRTITRAGQAACKDMGAKKGGEHALTRTG